MALLRKKSSISQNRQNQIVLRSTFHVQPNNKPYYKVTLLLQDFRFLSHFSFSISHLHYNNQIFEEEKNKTFLLFKSHTSRYFVIYFNVCPFTNFDYWFVYLHSSSSLPSVIDQQETFL